MINWKIVAIFPFFATVISILSGAIGGASFLDIILRALLWAVIFGGIGIGVSFLIERFFPELKGIMGGTGEPAGEKSRDEGGFEAFIPEDNPHELDEMKSNYAGSEENEGRRTGAGDSGEEDIGVLYEAEESGQEDDFASFGESDGDSIGGYGNDSGGNTESGPDFGAVEDGPGVSESGENSANASKKSKTPDTLDDETSLVFDTDGIDKLPDSLSSDDSLSLPQAESSFDSGGIFSKPYKGSNVSEFEQDPQKTAKAIHTMLQRDKEG
jgi:hypothetical protein